MPRRKPVPQESDEIVEIFPEVPQPVAAEPVNDEKPLPNSLKTVMEMLMGLLPETRRGEINSLLANAIQTHINNIKAELDANGAREIAKVGEDLKQQMRDAITKKMADIEKAAGPTNPEEMRTLVSQEYLEFPITLTYVEDDGDEEFTKEIRLKIRELPQSKEKQIVDAITDQVIPLVKKFQSISFRTGATNADKLGQLVKVAPEVLEVMADVTAIALNPRGKHTFITKEWVRDNIASSRQMAIIEAQFMANRIRDFFYAASRVIPRT